jgi:hypothetical protein
MLMRRGTTLVEILVALVLGAALLGVAARSVTVTRRSEHIIASTAMSASIADEVIGVVAASLERVSSADTVVVRADTAIDFDLPIGGGLACVAGGDSIAFRDDETATWWETSADSGDGIDALIQNVWWRTEIVSSRVRSSVSGACAGTQRVLKMRSALPASHAPPIVRVRRRIRLMVYRSGDTWWFGQRTCSLTPPNPCTSAQPISGPLLHARWLTFDLDTLRTNPVVTVSAATGKTTRVATLALRQ